ncbi:MAG: hypothetical protein JW784_06745 [Candidatus Cloacimonetes bacterium]|nr:hypothetical protein [Candidatus Cloacimonadota bacterium]
MRPIERKVLSQIKENGLTQDQILEIIDRTSTQEMKKSFPDDCLFQSDKYFTRIIIDTLLRLKLIRQENDRFFKAEKKKVEENQSIASSDH